MENIANKVARIPNLVDWSTGEVRLLSAKSELLRDLLLSKGTLSTSPGCSRKGVADVLLPKKGKLASLLCINIIPAPAI